ncbi:hypothetical protein [Roseovarius rhodophyticola]|uniref:Uncharacterized protein n=1 Tax=Roseovarius rhodophyticola TaxID=3080827 RepID=A0ABZ2TIY7_9RHOB|nr:hypothetical protein [Roseovarius sp. W115]MDV2929823.1 hypothetical protein [Roseovarius sp. W115]
MTKSISATSEKDGSKLSQKSVEQPVSKPVTKSITVSRQVFNDFACI